MFYHTFLTFISKKLKANSVADLCIISPRNITYELLTKVISNLLSGMLNIIILDTQATFTVGVKPKIKTFLYLHLPDFGPQ